MQTMVIVVMSVPIKALFESHLTVADLERSVAFYGNVVGLELAHRAPERHAAFFWVGESRQSMLGLWSIHSSPLSMRLHIAFSVSLENVRSSVERLRQARIEPRHGLTGAPIDEPIVIGWMPAATVFFDDPDGHLLEYICILDDGPQPDWGWLPLSQWSARTAGSARPERAISDSESRSRETGGEND
jgi:catechol 2,3-dioxygenase-like lactoylglutathione lyase family enzyme